VIGQHAAVAQLQNVLRPLMSPTSQLSVYDPANALIITDYADNVRRLLRIIERIDQPASTDVTVIPVQHASAIDLAELVVRLSGTGVTTPGTLPGAPPGQIAAGGDRFSVVPDGRTNSILLRSDNPGRIALLRSLIERLDVPARSIGAFANFPAANPSIAAAVAAPGAAAATASGLTVAVLGKTITLPDGTTVRGLGALARALTANQLGNILSTPNILTLDNYQAKIVVGQNVPFVTGSFATAAAVSTAGTPAVNPFQTIERRDVGLTLRIKPQISEGSTVRLEIYQEVSDVATTTTAGASDLITNKRSIETKVVVDDGNTIVLGGLIQNTLNQTTQAVPFLGAIPFLGALFRFRSEERKRT